MQEECKAFDVTQDIYTLSYLPKNYNFDNFPWVAVPRDSVDEK